MLVGFIIIVVSLLIMVSLMSTATVDSHQNNHQTPQYEQRFELSKEDI